MKPVRRLVPCLAGKLVKRLVLLVADFRFVFQPKRLDFIDALAIEQNRETNKVAVGLDEMFDPRFGRVLGAILFQVHDDLRAALLTQRIGNFITARAIAGPHQLSTVGTPTPRMHTHFVGHHEGGIKPDAKLADHVRWRSAAFLHRFEKGLGARVRDGAEILHQLIMRHADAMIGNSQGLGLLIGRDVNLERQVSLMNVLLGRL